MSILITGLDMPDKKNGAVLTIYPNGDAVFEDGYHYKVTPVPPHGRCIDVDALIDAIIAKYIRHERNRELVFTVAEIKQDLADIINELPTIIPASEEGE